jgi:tripartite-type tricarboxylate transporter receptor subunit TctC
MKRVVLAAVFAALSHIAAVHAQNYPTRSGTVIVPFAPGGPADITGRIAAEILSKALGQQFVVENVGGAGGATGTTRAARAAPDGYTLALGHMGTHAAAVALTPNLAYNPQTDFEPIGLMSTQPVVLVTRKSFPANNLREFVTYAKANAAKLNMARAVHRHGTGAQRHARRAGRLRVRSDPRTAVAHPRRQPEGDGGCD